MKKTFDVGTTNSADAIDAAGLNWAVRQAPVLFEGNGLKEYKEKVVNFREDTGDALGIVGAGYKVVQNKTAFAFIDSIVGEQIEIFVSAGEFGGGKRVYIQAKLPGDIRFAGNDKDRGTKLVTFISSHDGSLPVSVLFTPVRIVCQNTFNAALTSTDQVRRKHTAALNLDTIKAELGILNRQFDLLANLSEKLAGVRFNDGQVKNLLTVSGLVPATLEGVEASTRAKNITDKVTGLFAGLGKGSDLDGSKGTAWGAWNALTEYIDHHRTTKGDSDRFESALIGSGARAKESALSYLATL